MYFASEGCCSEGFTCRALVNSSRGKLLCGRFRSKQVKDKSHRGSSQSSQPEWLLWKAAPDKEEWEEEPSVWGGRFVWMVSLQVPFSPACGPLAIYLLYLLFIYSLPWKENTPRPGFRLENPAHVQWPFYTSGSKTTNKTLGKKKKQPIKDLSWRPRPIFLSHSMVCTAQWNLNLERGPHK